MRVIAARLRDETGATALMAGMLLLVFFGMLAMTVDSGALLGLRRRLVAAADAGALAAAQSCARGVSAAASSQADALAKANVGDAARTSFSSSGCGTRASGSASVSYRASADLVFAPLIGASSLEDVNASATAIWGPAGTTRPMPIELTLDANGDLPCVAQSVGSSCNYWQDNDTDRGIGNHANWGLLSLSSWDMAPGDPCPNPGSSSLRDWITGSDGPSAALRGDGPTLACTTTGHKSNVWFDALASQAGTIRHFPINDASRMVVDPPGKAKYAIVGFAPLRIKAVLKGNDPAAVGPKGACGPRPSDPNGVCLVLEWAGPQIGGTPGSGRDFGLRAIRLSE